MTVRLLQPDAPQTDAPPAPARADTDAFAHAVDALGAIFEDAKAAEDSYAAGGGSLREAMYERARADVALAVAVAAAQRTAQAVQSVFNMQI
ncbi:MAG TPA: flagellar hook-basal body complex protein FliE [Candidatus Tyrphobacter sp.]